MNTITITMELCAEDRARLDRLAEAMEKRACDSCVTSALEIMKSQQPDPVQKALAETLAKAETPAEAPKTATEATEAEPLPTIPEEKEEPAEAKDSSDAPPVTLEQIQQKVISIAAVNKDKKAKVREIINAYGSKVSDLKDKPDKWAEVWAQLAALESEA